MASLRSTNLASVPTHAFASCFDYGQAFLGSAMGGENGFGLDIDALPVPNGRF
jgi:hypothetical protein